MKIKKKDVAITFRTTPEVKKIIEEISTEKNMSNTEFIEFCVKYYFTDYLQHMKEKR